MDVIVLAGGKTTREDPLYDMVPDGLKAMIYIAGKPMVQWVLDALSDAKLVESVVVIGIDEASNLRCSKDITFLKDEGSLINNIQQGCVYLDRIHPQYTHVITISADIPTLTSDIIDQSIEMVQKFDLDVCYTVLDRAVMEKRFPNSKRTYVKIKDGDVCGGDLNYIRKKAVLQPAGLWEQLIKTRKNPLKQAFLIGFDTLVLMALRRLTLEDAAKRVCKRLGITGKAVRSPFAEIGMDVDKPFQFEIVEKDLLR